MFSACLQALQHRVSNIENSGKEIVKAQLPRSVIELTQPLHGVIIDNTSSAVRGKLVLESEEKRKELPEGINVTPLLEASILAVR